MQQRNLHYKTISYENHKQITNVGIFSDCIL